MAHQTFSSTHPFSRTQVEEAATAVANEGRFKRSLLSATTGHRSFALRQFWASQIAYWTAVIAIFAVERFQPSIEHALLNLWAGVAFLTWAARTAVYAVIFSVSPARMAKSISLRLTPLVLLATTAAFWAWTVHLMVGHQLTLTTFAIFAGFTMMSIAIMGLWPTTPVAAGMYALTLWGALSAKLIQMDTVPVSVVLSMDACIFVILWIYLYVAVVQLRPLLERSDKLDLSHAELRDANAALEGMRNDLRATLERRSEFFAEASHDFVQRIHGMKLMASSTIADLTVTDRSRHALKRVTEEVDALEQYIRDVLDFARIEALDQAASLAQVPLQSVFQKLDLHFESLADAQGTVLRIRPTRTVLLTDAAMLQRILENLVSNALKFTRNGVLVAARHSAGSTVIEVWDQGPGIGQERLATIFEAFRQDVQHPMRGARGVGLGLAVVKRFAASLNYPVTVRSRQGYGSVFRVHIPAASQPTRALRPSAAMFGQA